MSIAKRVDEGPGPPAFVPNQNAELMKPAVAETTVGRAGSGANGRIWPAMMSAELPEGWA